jgi:hypothetical protein
MTVHLSIEIVQIRPTKILTPVYIPHMFQGLVEMCEC